MRKLHKNFASFLGITLLVILGLTSVLADPPQGRWRGKERRPERRAHDGDYHDDCRGCRDGQGRKRNFNKKEEKFINGHDARDGRWDGRGPKPRFRRLPPRRSFR